VRPAVETCDVAVIGAGMGGGTIGHALAERGHRVLFLERGPSQFDPAKKYAENLRGAERMESGNWPEPMTVVLNGKQDEFYAPMGCGVGGSSLLYAACLERFERSDFEAIDAKRGAWPIDYDTMRPYYDRAEQLYGVRGTPDPRNPQDASRVLLKPAPKGELDTALMRSLEQAGLHPYQLPVARTDNKKCEECLGYVCPQACKGDSRRIAIQPAVATGCARVLDHCEVLRIDADRTQARSIQCLREGKPLEVRAKVVVLAAGAYMSPKLLLASRNTHWPQGLGNDHDTVGRYLMFHLVSFLAVWPLERHGSAVVQKTLGFRDFYREGNDRMGAVQSMGVAIGYGNVLAELRGRLQRWRIPAKRLVWHALRIPAYIASKLFGRAVMFGAIVEDLAYRDNRVVLDDQQPSGMRVEYTVHDELYRRARLFRHLCKTRMGKHRIIFLNDVVAPNYGHPCGSLRMGTDPKTSVVDADCRVHGLSNLYAADASVFTSSAGANPSLTVAANALRVSEAVHAALRANATT
jgi:choline dehydrogenase-like flavoprotein